MKTSMTDKPAPPVTVCPPRHAEGTDPKYTAKPIARPKNQK
jgi:hypothetical protein